MLISNRTSKKQTLAMVFSCEYRKMIHSSFFIWNTSREHFLYLDQSDSLCRPIICFLVLRLRKSRSVNYHNILFYRRQFRVHYFQLKAIKLFRESILGELQILFWKSAISLIIRCPDVGFQPFCLVIWPEISFTCNLLSDFLKIF